MKRFLIGICVVLVAFCLGRVIRDYWQTKTYITNIQSVIGKLESNLKRLEDKWKTASFGSKTDSERINNISNRIDRIGRQLSAMTDNINNVVRPVDLGTTQRVLNDFDRLKLEFNELEVKCSEANIQYQLLDAKTDFLYASAYPEMCKEGVAAGKWISICKETTQLHDWWKQQKTHTKKIESGSGKNQVNPKEVK